jgi:hypothetical protein
MLRASPVCGRFPRALLRFEPSFGFPLFGSEFLLDEQCFGSSRGLTFVPEGFEELFEFGRIFIGEKHPVAREAMPGIVSRKDTDAFLSLGAGGVLSIGLIG